MLEAGDDGDKGDYDGDDDSEGSAEEKFKGFGQFVDDDLNIDEWVVEMETEGMEYLSVILSIFHYFGGYFRMRNLSYFRRLFSRYSYRSPGRPSKADLYLSKIAKNHLLSASSS